MLIGAIGRVISPQESILLAYSAQSRGTLRVLTRKPTQFMHVMHYFQSSLQSLMPVTWESSLNLAL